MERKEWIKRFLAVLSEANWSTEDLCTLGDKAWRLFGPENPEVVAKRFLTLLHGCSE